MIQQGLTATATILGLVPLAVGFNIDFESLFAHGDPKIFFGGDSVAFWGPLSWTIVFGLGFATVTSSTAALVADLDATGLLGETVVLLTTEYSLAPGFCASLPLAVEPRESL